MAEYSFSSSTGDVHLVSLPSPWRLGDESAADIPLDFSLDLAGMGAEKYESAAVDQYLVALQQYMPAVNTLRVDVNGKSIQDADFQDMLTRMADANFDLVLNYTDPLLAGRLLPDDYQQGDALFTDGNFSATATDSRGQPIEIVLDDTILEDGSEQSIAQNGKVITLAIDEWGADSSGFDPVDDLISGWQEIIDWLALPENATVKGAVYGYELANEPGSSYLGGFRAEYYAEDIEDVVDALDAHAAAENYDWGDAKFLVNILGPGSGNIENMVPERVGLGGVNALEYIAEAVDGGRSAADSRLVWSLHQRQQYSSFDQFAEEYGEALSQYDLIITETRLDGDIKAAEFNDDLLTVYDTASLSELPMWSGWELLDPITRDTSDYNHYELARELSSLTDNGIGFAWWGTRADFFNYKGWSTGYGPLGRVQDERDASAFALKSWFGESLGQAAPGVEIVISGATFTSNLLEAPSGRIGQGFDGNDTIIGTDNVADEGKPRYNDTPHARNRDGSTENKEALAQNYAGDKAYGLGGNDTIDLKGGDDFAFGNDGEDVIFLGSGHDIALGGAGNDTLFGDQDADGGISAGGVEGDDVLEGQDGDDQLFGGGGRDLVIGGSGNDALGGGEGADVFAFFSGDGLDVILDYDETDDQLFIDGVQVNLSALSDPSMSLSVNPLGQTVLLYNAGADQIQFGIAATPGVVSGTGGADLIDVDYEGDPEGDRVTAGNDTIDAGAGNDIVRAADGDDLILGNTGTNDLLGGRGNDTIDSGDGGGRLFGDDGADHFVLQNGTTVRVMDFQLNVDKIDVSDWGIGSFNDLTIEDRLTGRGDATDQVWLSDDAGNYLRVYTPGIDSSASRFDAGDFIFAGVTAPSPVAPPSGAGIVSGTGGADLIDVDYEGDPEGDRVTAGNDTIDAGAGNDIVRAADGDDLILGNTGTNDLLGGRGNDTIDSGDGGGRLFGDDGADHFVLQNGTTVRVMDFQLNVDKIDVSDWGIGSFNDLTIEDRLTGRGDATDQVWLSDDAGNYLRVYTPGIDSSASRFDAGDFIFAGVTAPSPVAPPSGAGIVSGTGGADLIDVDYEGDPEGDRVTAGNDTIDAGAGNDIVRAADGDDLILGNTGTNDLLGGRGNDTIDSGDGGGRLFGDDGADHFVLQNGTTVRVMDFQLNVDKIDVSDWGIGSFNDLTIEDRLTGRGDATDQVWLSDDAGNYLRVYTPGIDSSASRFDAGDFIFAGVTAPSPVAPPSGAGIVSGTGGADLIDVDYEGDPEGDRVTAGNDTIDAGAGNDIVRAADGDDLILGNTGTNDLLGGRGNDTIDSGDGGGRLFGDEGADHFVLQNGTTVRVMDFQLNVDKIDVSDWGNGSFNDLTIEDRLTGRGDATDQVWLSDDAGNYLRVYTPGIDSSASRFDAGDFIFAGVTRTGPEADTYLDLGDGSAIKLVPIVEDQTAENEDDLEAELIPAW